MHQKHPPQVEARKRKEPEAATPETTEVGSVSKAQKTVQESNTPTTGAVGEQPTLVGLSPEIKNRILNFLVTGRGKTNEEKLQSAAASIRNYMTTHPAFQGFLADETITGKLIQELAKRYTGGNVTRAALALRTDAAGRWLVEEDVSGTEYSV